jgi:CDP-glucose 4,6-dehydratase
MVMNASFWKKKKVFVTGHTGFKGSWFSLWLQRLGAEVVGFSLDPPTKPSLFQAARVERGMRSLLGDVKDLELLRSAVKKHKPDIVFHLAAQSLVRRSYEQPVETYASNVMGTVNVLEAIRAVGSVRVFVNVTSDKCYENREWMWGYRENEPLGGRDPYSSSKACSELVTSAYRASFFKSRGSKHSNTAIATARAGNVIGGGDWAPDRLISDMVSAAAEKKVVKIRNPHAIRPWQHVLEPLRGYLTLGEHLWERGDEFAEAWNFGPLESDAKPVSWIVERLAELWKNGVRWQVDSTPQPHEAHYLRLDCSKAHARLKFSSKLCLDTALQWTVQWYQDYYRKQDAREITEEQIQRYQDLSPK